MEQLTDLFSPDDIIPIDYGSAWLLKAGQKLKPTVYRDETGYSCSYGPNTQTGILDFDCSPEDTMRSWNKACPKEGIKFYKTGEDGKG